MLGDGVPVLAKADLRIVNLECVVATRGEAGRAKGEGGPYYYRARPEMLAVLREAGVDIVATANNHSGDYGPEALMQQAALLDAAGIGHAGSGPTAEAAFAPVLRRAGDLEVALFSIDATQPRYAAGPSTPGHAWLPLASPAAWTAALAPRIAAARERAHVVLVAVHWGRSGLAAPEADEIAVGHALIDAGTDAVLGASAHVLQGVEIHRGRPIIHDAGDLLFDAVRRDDDGGGEGGVFSLELCAHGVRRVVFTPVAVGFGRTVQRQGADAVAAADRFAAKCQALGTAFVATPSGACFVDLAPPPRGQPPRPASPRSRIDCPAIPPLARPRGDWLVPEVPADARLAVPLRLGPLWLLGARTAARELTSRRMLFVETFWQLAEPTGEDWRLDVRAVPVGPATMPAWGIGMDHDPCDWMWPTSRWRPGLIHRDFHGLRPPPAGQLHAAELRIEVGLVSATARLARKALDLRVRLRMGAAAAPPPAASASQSSSLPDPPPRYRTISRDALPPDLPEAPGQTWNAAQLAAVTGGTWRVAPPPGWFVRSVVRGPKHLDMLPAPTLFVASDYETLARHERYVPPASNHNWDRHARIAGLQPRLAGAIVSGPVAGLAPDFPLLQVDDPIRALIELGAAARERLRGRVVAITGSAGKTSVCRMLDHAFSHDHRVVSTIDNYNSRVGLLAMLANVPARTDLVVLETAISAINAPGFRNIRLVRPDVAIITNIAPAHLGVGQRVEDIARRKANLFEGMAPGGRAILCVDSDFFDELAARARARGLEVLSYGGAASADIRLEGHDAASGRVRARLRGPGGGETLDYTLGAPGRHMAVNSLACLAVARALGLDAGRAAARLASFAAVEGRGQVLQRSHEGRAFRIIDESYNANPLSMAAALAMLADGAFGAGRRLLVLGDMLELGEAQGRYHEALVAPIVQCAPTQVFLLGPCMTQLRAPLAAALPAAGVHAHASTDAIERALGDGLAPGDVVLFKASHGMGLWKIVERLGVPPHRPLPQPARPLSSLPPAAVIRRSGAARPAP